MTLEFTVNASRSGRGGFQIGEQPPPELAIKTIPGSHSARASASATAALTKSQRRANLRAMELDREARPLVERDLGRTYRYLIRWLDSPVLIDRTKRTVVRTTGDPDRFDVAAALRPGARA